MRLTKKSTRNALVAALTAAALILVLSIGGVVSSAQSGFEGDYDYTFGGGDGYYIDPQDPDPTIPEWQLNFVSGALLGDGSIIAGGNFVDASVLRSDFYLRKFTPAGDVVTSFGTNGLVRTNFFASNEINSSSSDFSQVLKVQPDGKILVAGLCLGIRSPDPNTIPTFGNDACLVRYNADGTLDASFGNSTLQTGGGINGSGEQLPVYSFQVGAGKFAMQTGLINRPGAPGPLHGTSGRFNDMVIQPDGKIVLVGETTNEYGTSSFAGYTGNGGFIVRLNPNGTLDSTFGSGGVARWTAPQGPPPNCYPGRGLNRVLLQPDGRIVAVGYDEITRAEEPCDYGQRFAVTRWTSAGQFETVRHLDSPTDVGVRDQAAGVLLAGGGSKVMVSGKLQGLATMARLNLGTLAPDTTFGTGGIQRYDNCGSNQCTGTLYIKAIQSDGKILGLDTDGGTPVVRFNADGTPDLSFGNPGQPGGSSGGQGRLRLNMLYYNGQMQMFTANHLLLRPNGRIVLLGATPQGPFNEYRAAVSQQNTELPSYTLSGRVTSGAGAGVSGVTVTLSGAQSASATTDDSGDYSFEGLASGGDFTVTPSKAGLSFVPASRSLTNLSADQLSVNFTVPSLSVNNVTVTEGNTGEGTATFTVTLKPASTQPVTVKYQTANSTALAPGDYTALALTTLTFAPGETTKAVAVQVKGDTLDEPSETFRLVLSAPTNALITDNEGVCTITDNDAPPVIRVNNIPVNEGNSATVATFSIALSNPSAQTVTVKYQTVNKTAVAGRDYTAKPLTTLTFAPFQTVKTVPVSITGDLIDEPAETFDFVLSSPTNATLGVYRGVATINDNDGVPTLSVWDVTVTEPDAGTRNAIFTIKMSPVASGKTVTVKYATANGTATAGTDYTALALATLTFAPGETTKTVTVPVRGDTTKEANETFKLNLSGPVNATISDAQGQATITNDD